VSSAVPAIGLGAVSDLAPSALVLFDIDGTLIRRAGPHHRDALAEAVRRVTGFETSLDRIPTHGSLDRDLIAAMLLRAGASGELIRAAMPGIVEEAQSVYASMRPDLRRALCPGVRPVLRRLYASGVPLGLVTGNLTAIGWKKMENAGLNRYFRFGAFAEQAETRAGLVAIALRQARRAGWLRAETRATLVGDHPNDVLAAKLNGIRSVAVATGMVPRSALVAHSPDVLLPDLRCLKLEMLL
jgi:phosphoglycolate phosphatase-like HAD superfamily hydrolase